MNFDFNSIVRRAADYLNYLTFQRKVVPDNPTPTAQVSRAQSIEPNALTPLQSAVLKIITEELHQTSTWFEGEFSRDNAINVLIHALCGFRDLPLDALGGAIDDLVKAGRLLESADGILSIPNLELAA